MEDVEAEHPHGWVPDESLAPSATFYWLGSVDAIKRIASGTWIGLFFSGEVNREDGSWSAERRLP